MGRANQQERLSDQERAKWFFAGFVEGEGSLTVSIKEHPASRFGFYVDPEFFVTQHDSGRRLLEMAREMFKTGRIFPKPGSPDVLTFAITDRRSLREQVVPFFERYVAPLTCKGATFAQFREILERMNRKEHHEAQGLVAIVKLAYAMNPAGKGRERSRTLEAVCERILRDYTLDASSDEAKR